MDFDVVVIGAGAGGLLIAARLAHLGGRASIRDVDGFKVNNGAIVIETGGITEPAPSRCSRRRDCAASPAPADCATPRTSPLPARRWPRTGGACTSAPPCPGPRSGTRDDWPPQRAVAGSDLPPGTPVASLWNVGDGVKEYANGGTTACAETAQLVAAQVAARYPLSRLRTG